MRQQKVARWHGSMTVWKQRLIYGIRNPDHMRTAGQSPPGIRLDHGYRNAAARVTSVTVRPPSKRLDLTAKRHIQDQVQCARCVLARLDATVAVGRLLAGHFRDWNEARFRKGPLECRQAWVAE